MTPLVSILIPAYNASAWIDETLKSALAQTHSRCEIIVVDDGSIDDTYIRAQRYSNRGVLAIAQANAGASAARNHALRLCKGDYIQFLDADDILSPNKIGLQLKKLENAPSNSIASSSWGRFTGSIDRAVFTTEENWIDTDPITWLQLNFSGNGMMPPIAWLAPRAIIDAAGSWDESLSLNDDGEYYCRVLLAASKVVFCAEAHCYYRSNILGSLSTSNSPQAWDSGLRSQIASAEHLCSVNNSVSSRSACANMFIRLAHASYPDAPAVSLEAERLSFSYGGSDIRPGGGKLLQCIDYLCGWKVARQMQVLGCGFHRK